MTDSSAQTTTPTSFWHSLFNRRIGLCIYTGFSSGLPLYILISLLPAWLKTESISMKDIGLFALVQLPYAWKFLWAPLVDGFYHKLFGRRRSWLLGTQILLCACILPFGFIQPQFSLSLIFALAVAVALFSATQDIAIDAYRREILHEHELGLGNSIHVNAYRLAGLIPGSLALILADFWPWQLVFIVTGSFMLISVAITYLMTEPVLEETAQRDFYHLVIGPFQEFIQRNGVWGTAAILSFMFLYKLGDSMATALATPFYLDMGFSLTEIGLVAKHAALWPSIIGGLLGGVIMLKIGINKCLWLFGLVQIITILGFALLANTGHNLYVLATVLCLEYLGVGLGTAAFVAYIARSTNRQYTATQLAILTAITAFPRIIASAITGYLVEAVGWFPFFIICYAIAIPGMLMLIYIAPWREKQIT